MLRGQLSAFSLELPPYRMPQVGQVLLRSLLDRTLFVLGRAVTVAAPAGLVIWVLGRVPVGSGTLLTALAGALAKVVDDYEVPAVDDVTCANVPTLTDGVNW